MNRKKILVALSVVLLAVFVGVFAQQKAQQSRSSLGLEIISKDSSLYLPVSTSFKTPVSHVRLQSDKSSTEQISALRIAPQMEDGKIKVSVFALYGDASAAKTCREWYALKAENIASYTIGEGESVAVSEFDKYGIKLGEKQFTLRVVPAKPMPVSVSASNDCICGVCLGTPCCPAPGECTDCGPCGPTCCPFP